MDKGVDGFKVVAASHLVEDEDLRDEPVATPKEPNKVSILILHTCNIYFNIKWNVNKTKLQYEKCCQFT